MKSRICLLTVTVLLASLHQAVAQTWTQINVANTNWFGVTPSADGSVLFAAAGNTNVNAIYIS
ncbi:MAG TPA: hypothetical protein VF430_01325, partial [Verrucomicrobiae bacterium]